MFADEGRGSGSTIRKDDHEDSDIVMRHVDDVRDTYMQDSGVRDQRPTVEDGRGSRERRSVA